MEISFSEFFSIIFYYLSYFGVMFAVFYFIVYAIQGIPMRIANPYTYKSDPLLKSKRKKWSVIIAVVLIVFVQIMR